MECPRRSLFKFVTRILLNNKDDDLYANAWFRITQAWKGAYTFVRPTENRGVLLSQDILVEYALFPNSFTMTIANYKDGTL